MSGLVDLVLLTTRTGIAGPALLSHHSTANLGTEFFPAFHSGYFHHEPHIPSRNNHHYTSHSPDCGELVSLLFPAEVHVSVVDWVANLSFLQPGYYSRDFLFRDLLFRDLHYLGFRCLSRHGRGFSRHCY